MFLSVNNKTNGVPRRWLLLSNPPLADATELSATGGSRISTHCLPRPLAGKKISRRFLRPGAPPSGDSPSTQMVVRQTVDPDTIFDAGEAIHEYKRQP